MTIEEVKEYLNGAYYIDKRIDVLQDELTLLESRLEKCTPSYTSNRGGGNQPSFEYVLDRVLQYRERLNNEIDNLVDTKEDIKKVISKVENPKARLILTQKYINFHTFEYIAEKLKMEERQIRRIHKKSIETLSKML